MSTDRSLPSPQCRNCGAPLTGRWCAACGQKALGDEERRLGHLLGQFAHELFHLDGKLPRSLLSLLFRPGQLSIDYLSGRRARHLSPIALFLLINLAYFLAPPLSDFNLGLEEQLQLQPYSAWIQPMVERRLQNRSLEMSDYAARYRASTEHLAESLIIVHLPMLALVLLLLFPRRPIYYAEHFVVATHLFSLLLLLLLLFSALMASLHQLHQYMFEAALPLRLNPLQGVFGAILGAVWLVWVKRVYRIDWWRAVLVAIAAFAGLALAHLGYRLLQFLLVFAST